MKPKTEELLYFLLWTADSMLRPTWRNATDPFETWAWRNGLSRRLADLEAQKILERHPEADLTRVVRLTEHGKTLALGGRDPIARWSRPWDGQWRLVLFDLPTGRHDLRQNLLRVLRRNHFGYLQNSVWISPDPAAVVREALGDAPVQADAFLIIEGRPAGGESDAEIALAAWDLAAINTRYEQYLAFIQKPPVAGPRFVEWARRENALWMSAVRADPLLPSRLLPSNYLGQEAIQNRKKLFARLLSTTSAVLP